MQEHVPACGPARVHTGDIPVCRPRGRRPGLVPGRLGRAAPGAWQGRTLLPRRHHIVGHRLRRGQPARRLHQDLEVRAVDFEERHVMVKIIPCYN